MNRFLLLFFVGAMAMAQTTIDLSMEPRYAKDVFFNFADNSNVSYPRGNWDVAFYRVSSFDQAVRINTEKGLGLYEVSNNVEDWDNISVADMSQYTELFNGDKDWREGGFNQGSATYGWGEYSMATHHVVGTVIFVIEQAIDRNTSKYYKFMIVDYFGGYTIKYSEWNDTDSTWGEDVTKVISNSENPDRYFNYFNITTGELVEASPAMDKWDLKFTQYITRLAYQGGTVPYPVTGVLHSPNVTVAQVEEEEGSDFADTNTLVFSEDINTIGFDWKQLNQSFQYQTSPTRVYYVKSNDKVYRMRFKTFEGSSTGNLSFEYEEESLSTLDLAGNTKFAVYPNPVLNKEVTIVYENTNNVSSKISVELYNLTGQKVYETQLSQGTGLFQKTLKLSNVSQGIYIMKVISGNDVKTEKLIVK